MVDLQKINKVVVFFKVQYRVSSVLTYFYNQLFQNLTPIYINKKSRKIPEKFYSTVLQDILF